MKSKVISAVLLTLVLTVSCNNSENKKTETAEQSETLKNYVLLGKKAKLEYPDFTAEVQYISDTELHWKTTDTEGKEVEGSEKIDYKQLNASQFFVNWIEQDGITVSQIVDMQKGDVTVYISHEDKNSPRGKRAGNLIAGKWTEINE